MIQSLVSVSALLMGVALLLGGIGVLNTLLALRGSLEGFSASVIGFVMSSYFAGYLVGTWLGPRVIGRVGHIRAFALFSAVASSVTLIHVLWVDPWVWAMLRVIAGVAMVGLYTVIESWLNVVAPRESRGRVFASYMLVNFLALAAAQVMLVNVDIGSFTLFAFAAILISLSLTPVVLTGLHQPPLVPVPAYAASRMLKTAPLGAVGSLLSGVATAAVWGMVPLMAQAMSMTPGEIARLMIVMILAGGLAQIPAGQLGDRFDRRIVLLLLSIVATLSSIGLVVAVTYNHTPAMLGALAGIGAAGFCVYSACVALVNDHLDSSEIVPAASTLLLIHGAGAIAGPLLAGLLMQWIGPVGLGWHFVGAWTLLTIYALWRTVVATRVRQQSTGLRWVMRTSPVALELLDEDIT
ncbi:MAG: MFS transporter [Oceanococcaceae bacterium]